MPADYSKLKVAELKDVLKQRGIPQTGLSKKQQIIDTLEEDDAKKGEPVLSDAAGPLISAEGGTAEEAEGTAGEVEAADEEVEHVEGDAKDHEEAAAETEQLNAEPEAQPTTITAVQPVEAALATPQPTSDLPEESGSESRKRKRRSPTPEVSEESVSKKLKAAEEAEEEVVVRDESMVVDDVAGEKQEDAVVEGAPVPLDGAADTIPAQPYGSSDDVMRDVEPEQPTSTTTMAPSERLESDSIHPPTTSLYIRDLIRPLQPSQLQDHLTQLIPSDSATSIQTFHLDTLRTHAFAVFSSPTIALAVRNALHHTIFPPDDPTRKPLWVDFVPEDKAQEWIETELAAGTSRRDAKKWEVEYDSSYGDVQVSLREVRPGAAAVQRQGSTSQMPSTGVGIGMPNAPSGPRGNGPRGNDAMGVPPTGPRGQSRPEDFAPAQQNITADTSDSTALSASRKSQPPSFSALDAKFSATNAKPKLYFLPQPPDLAERRLAELERETSRSWHNVRSDVRDGEGVDGQLRRYTFEDGDRLVDGGPDRGNFGAPMGDGGARGGYGGRGGGLGGGRGRGSRGGGSGYGRR